MGNCLECKHAYRIPNAIVDQPEYHLECRRNPPQPGSMPHSDGRFPIVKQYWACGEWKALREEA